VLAHADQHRNLAVLGPERACYGGVVRNWDGPGASDALDAPYWDVGKACFRLGDFTAFAAWIERYLFGQVPSAMEASPSVPAPAGEQ